ncbi:MAG: tRNA 5-methoxyuridine(34)/uridine 5-oxyacetic acid(34) synthase CmoB [Bacteriovoracales bacterium]|nr:tRNA 5-methoxyuridine(34)/uridine 5-oxyacetic acid(34) synthase CmoB [Bacteriovoracales bacterium]
MGLEYLKDFPGAIDFDTLERIKSEREKGWDLGLGPKYRNILSKLPRVLGNVKVAGGAVSVEGDIGAQEREVIERGALELKNWRKGPFELFGLLIDSEWRSDLKWNRLKSKLGDLSGQTVLDIGCNNGHFMYQMKEAGSRNVLGIDPTIHFCAQFRFVQHFAQVKGLHFELFGVDELTSFRHVFDTVFSLGILYHHPHPLKQLKDIHEALRPGGRLILETIGLEGESPVSFCPVDRYAGMKKIWFIPTLPVLLHWMKKSLFTDIEVISTEWEGESEQRSTPWSAPVSYRDFLNPRDKNKTVEGHPAPLRFIVQGRKR